MKKFIRDLPLYILITLAALAIFGSLYLVMAGESRVETHTYTFESVEYTCDHYPNGDMECEQVGDPDVGGGRITP